MYTVRKLLEAVTVLSPGKPTQALLFVCTADNQKVVLPPLKQSLGFEYKFYLDNWKHLMLESVEDAVIHVPGETDTTQLTLYNPVTCVIGLSSHWLVT